MSLLTNSILPLATVCGSTTSKAPPRITIAAEFQRVNAHAQPSLRFIEHANEQEALLKNEWAMR
jgi:hypothetical protein